ncbi:sensor histidine kinase [Saccharicrinis sp. FJH54]|uniref:sensor histidine kinase n=1 Tax=Saccharicrinis sp. FJH54 TaxID=3344665 RepID=UPI0035D3F128
MTRLSKTKFWITYHVGLMFFSLFAAMIMKLVQYHNAFHPTVLASFFTVFIMSISLGYLTIYLVNHSKKYSHKELRKKIIPGLLIFYLAAFIIANIAITLGVSGWYFFSGESFQGFWNRLVNQELVFGNARLLIWLLFFTLGFFIILWQKSAKKEQQLREENLRFKYRTLKSQVNPHFLFNSLNTLSELVYSDAKKADNYIQNLSQIYRYIIENEETDLLPLKNELVFVDKYFALQKARDNGKIELHSTIFDADQYQVIPVSVQMLIENALKHNAVSMNQPLIIELNIENDVICVKNNIQRKSTMQESTGTGLKNLKERVHLILNKTMTYKEEHNQFVVYLPLKKTDNERSDH